MTFGALWAFLAIALPVLASLLASLPSVDLAYGLRAGGEFLDGGGIARTDTYTFTAAGEPWLNQQWLAQVLLAGVHRAVGWVGLAVLRAALVGAIAGLVFVAARRQGLDRRTAALLTLAAFALAAPAMALRPQLLGMVLFAATLVLVVERRRHPRLLWLIPPIVLAWANIHGSFFLGPAVVGVAWLWDRRDRFAGAWRAGAVAIAAALASAITPFGPGVWAYAAGLSTNSAVRARITEWQPTTLDGPVGLAFYASALVVAAVLVQSAGRRTPAWPILLWFGAFFVLGAWAVRGVAWWPLAAAVGLAGVLGTGFLGSGAAEAAAPARERTDGPAARRLNAALAGLLVLAGIALLPAWRPIDPATGTPAGLVGQASPGVTAALRELVRPGDRIFAPQPLGSWLEFVVPAATVALDSRFELFPAEVWTAHDAIASGAAGWPDRLDAWGVTVVVATPADAAGLLDAIRGHQGWRLVHEGAGGAVFVRTDR